MKIIIFSFAFFSPLFSVAQNTPDTIPYGATASEIRKQLEDGYTLSSGWTIKEGDTLKIGKGTMPNKSYAFIYQSPANYFSETSASTYNKRYLLSNGAKVARVKDIRTYGTKKGGFTIVAVVGVGEIANYWIELDNAVDAGELIPPAEYATKKEGDQKVRLSTADELKKWKDLFDAGAITKEEYDAQKKKILEQQ